MYKIIIVDDEDEVREGIELKTDWSACGFELAGAFENGRDALDSIQSLQPDVIITDICMPFMDGLELARQVAEQYRDIVVVIVTGFEDFEYAKQAIKLKVKDYLLKPINSQEFTSFLLTLKQELDAQRQKREDLSHLQLQLNQSLPLLKERFLERLAATVIKKEEVERKFNYFQLSLSGPAYVALVGDIDGYIRDTLMSGDAEAELLRFAAFNIMQEIFEKESGGIVFRTRDDKIAVIFPGKFEEIEMQAQTLAEHARHSVQKYLRLTVSIGIGRVCTELSSISKSFQGALSALDYRFLLGKNRIISINDLEYGKGVDKAGYDAWERKLLATMKTGNSQQVSIVLSDGIEEMKHSYSSVENCYGSIHKLIASLMNLVVETGFDNAEVFGSNPFQHIAGMRTLDDAKLWLEGICHHIISYLSERRTDVTESQMKQAEAYIRENYSDEDFSLNQVCSHIFMSISYFSALFKQHTGLTFVEYLTRVRLEKAKELMAVTHLKTYDIASRVGYGDPQYFSVIFKRHTGLTPKEYRLAQKGNLSL
ncbi:MULTISPECIES: response regulator [unclassified Paenibacillus]|uniref:response regulator n=1 Tax=unclassified Paenibacillus TaxID=185978 RepID=UPI0036418598